VSTQGSRRSELLRDLRAKRKSTHLEDINLKRARLGNAKYVYISVQSTLTLNGREGVGKKIIERDVE
jgi:hypothetical protein